MCKMITYKEMINTWFNQPIIGGFADYMILWYIHCLWLQESISSVKHFSIMNVSVFEIQAFNFGWVKCNAEFYLKVLKVDVREGLKKKKKKLTEFSVKVGGWGPELNGKFR